MEEMFKTEFTREEIEPVVDVAQAFTSINRDNLVVLTGEICSLLTSPERVRADYGKVVHDMFRGENRINLIAMRLPGSVLSGLLEMDLGDGILRKIINPHRGK